MTAASVSVSESLLAVATYFDSCGSLAKGRQAEAFTSMADSMRRAALYLARLESVADSVRALQAQPHHQTVNVDTVPGVKVQRTPPQIGKGRGFERITVEGE